MTKPDTGELKLKLGKEAHAMLVEVEVPDGSPPLTWSRKS